MNPRAAPMGGIARAKALSPEQRSSIARHAAQTRWAKRKADLGLPDRERYADLVRRVLRGDGDAVALLRSEFGGHGWMVDAANEAVISCAPDQAPPMAALTALIHPSAGGPGEFVVAGPQGAPLSWSDVQAICGKKA